MFLRLLNFVKKKDQIFFNNNNNNFIYLKRFYFSKKSKSKVTPPPPPPPPPTYNITYFNGLNEDNEVNQITTEPVPILSTKKFSSSTISLTITKSNDQPLKNKITFCKHSSDESTKSYQLSIKKNVSAWHSISPDIEGSGYNNFLVEIEKGSTHKFQLSTTEIHNPIVQDYDDDGNFIFIKESPFTIGLIPQTYQDPNISDLNSPNFKGNGKPIQLIEIVGERLVPRGSIPLIYILGGFQVFNSIKNIVDLKLIGTFTDSRQFPINEEPFILTRILQEKPDLINSIINHFKEESDQIIVGPLISRENVLTMIEEFHQQYKQLTKGSKSFFIKSNKNPLKLRLKKEKKERALECKNNNNNNKKTISNNERDDSISIEIKEKN